MNVIDIKLTKMTSDLQVISNYYLILINTNKYQCDLRDRNLLKCRKYLICIRKFIQRKMFLNFSVILVKTAACSGKIYIVFKNK
ncbi:hypothetical protein SAMN05446037_103230 [Anaerovirgula multivorans]|uniref:Uncharacterized protein n=1 Tax=Anaerovirgula multivorans TaxID=312168 RepID=A0A239J2G4_9FIRM|nr:hypothetical protein SAMN05446037_103230 [Anaerovirgula multivorans]